VLEGLRPHDGLKALRMYCCSCSGIPTWMLELQGMVELKLQDCQNLEKLPALWQLQSLQFLHLSNLQNLHCLFSGGAPSKFQKLKMMSLENMPNFTMWWDRNEVQGEEHILFPEVENLRIEFCEKLIALPKASVIKKSSGRDGAECRSPFPALKGMLLRGLDKFHRWEAVQGSLGEQVTFPSLEQLEVFGCPELTTFPEAPKLRKVELSNCRKISLEVWATNKEENSAELEVVREHKSPLGDLCLTGCDLFFSGSSALALWKCFGQLATLDIAECDALVYWPEKLFQGLVSLRTLGIRMCNKLTGLTEDEASHEQSALVQRSGTLLPRLESLMLLHCESLVQVPNLLTSLKTLLLEECKSLKSIAFGEQQDTTGLETSSSLIAAGSSSSSNEDESTVSTAVVLKPVSSSSTSCTP